MLGKEVWSEWGIFAVAADAHSSPAQTHPHSQQCCLLCGKGRRDYYTCRAEGTDGCAKPAGAAPALLTGSPTRAFGLSGGGGPQLGCWTRTAFLKELAEQREIEGSWLRAALPISSDQLLREWKGRVIKDFSSAYVPQVSSFQKPLESEVTQTVPLNNSNLSRSYSIHKAGPWPWHLLSDNKNCMSKSPFKAASHLLHIKIIFGLSSDLPQLQREESWAPLNWVSSNIRIVISLQCFS